MRTHFLIIDFTGYEIEIQLLFRRIVNPRLFRLSLLVFPVNQVNLFSPLESCSGLVEMERHIISHALRHRLKPPSVITNSGVLAGFPAAGYQFNPIMVFLQEFLDVDLLQHRLMDDLLMPDRQLQDNRETAVRHLLVFTGATDMYVLVAGPQSSGSPTENRSGRLVMKKNCRSGRSFIMLHASGRHSSAAGWKKSEVKQV